MTETVKAQSGTEIFEIVLDFETWHWTSPAAPAEGMFPLIAHAREIRYEIYSDGTFAEVDDDFDDEYEDED